MKKNMGIVDRVARLIAAVVIVILYLSNVLMGAIGILLLVLAAVFVVTSIVGNCPLYRVFGMDTCSSTKKE
ncbi:DUF2892 domain-containing protein [uncultured Acetobacteroides sp.]|uniref:YgaP family membrane protein n=1 Tax=uncultured Acetobacteroides sp. TaxID=1760811 RepID=UPI0029F4F26F|nr:DUF2892 domain-containing protein [uncultured Acetobacteroides sp.]